MRSQALAGVKWSAIKAWYSQGLSLVVLLVMARLLDPSDFGLFAIGHVIVMLLSNIADQGLASALIRQKDVSAEHQHTVFWVATGISLSLAVLLVLARGPVASVFSAPMLAEILPALAAVQLLAALNSTANAMLVRNLKFRRSAIATIAAATFGGVVAIIMGYHGFGVWSLVGQHLVGASVKLLFTWLLAAWWPRAIFSKKHLFELWRFGALTMAGNLVGELNRRVDALLIGAFLGSYSVGLFAVGRRVIEMGNQTVTAAIGQVAFPSFAKMQDDSARMKVAYLNAIQSLLSITMPMFALLAVFSEEITRVALGVKWLEGAAVLQFLAIGAAIASINWLGGAVLMARGRSGLRLVMPTTSLVAAVVVVLTLYPYGIDVIAAGFALRGILMLPVVVFMVRFVLPVSYTEVLHALRPILFSTVGACALAIGMRYQLSSVVHSLVILGIGIPIALLTYWLLLHKAAPNIANRLLTYANEMFGRH